MARNDDLGSFFGILLGIIGAVALAKLLSETRCQRCNTTNPNSNSFCQNCGFHLR